MSYQLKEAEVAARMNVGAPATWGGSFGWIIKKLMGNKAANKLLDGPSYIVNIVLADIGGEVLMTESLTMGEELALLGCIPGSMEQ